MANEVIQEEELQYLLPFRREEHETLPSSKKPKLTIKYLNDLIVKLQHENYLLMERMSHLEQQLHECVQLQREAAAAAEQHALIESELKNSLGGDPLQDDQGASLISRSERHQSVKKPSFWAGLFRLRRT